MPEKTKKQIVFYLENINLGILGVFLLFLPLFFLSATTDAFILPKQFLLICAVTTMTIIIGIKTIIEGKIRLRASPFDLPVLLIAAIALASAIFAVNRSDAFIAVVPFIFALLLFFVITNTIKQSSQLLLILSALVFGAVVASLLSIFSFLKIYILPFSFTQATYFNPFGSLLDQVIYLALILPVTGYFVHSIFVLMRSRKKNSSVFGTNYKDAPHGASQSPVTPVTLGFSIAFLLIILGIGVTAFQLATTQKPLILPIETGFRTALAAISQDNGRVFWGFLFGSGFGTFITDFTRFKAPAFNVDPNLWQYTFFRSSTLILEILATTGILGLLAFIFLVYRIIKERNFFLPLILAVVSIFILPFSFTLIILFFVLLGIFTVIRAHNNPEKFNEVEFYFVALKRGLLATRTEGESVHLNTTEKKYSKLLPVFFLTLLLVLVGIPFYYSVKFFISDLYYQSSLVAYSQNKGLETYNLQLSSIKTFPYRDTYYRGISQINIALANSIALQSKGASPSAQNQQNILMLIQQAISAGRSAALMSQQSSYNWNNLSSVYRSLIGFGQNADQFAILTNQQAIALDPNNPQQYIDLGGIYYQLGRYDDAIQQFQLALRLKNDFANAYYNLGHALESKGNLQEAISAYQIVKKLVEKDSNNVKKISDEIQSLESKIANQKQQAETSAPTPQPVASSSASPESAANEGEPLRINQPPAQLPGRKSKVNIPGPTISITKISPAQSEPTPAQTKTTLTPKP